MLPCLIAGDGDRDGIPNVLAEAMAMGLPVVTTAVSGIPEIVSDGVDGAIVPPADAPALAVALEALLADPARRARLGAAARRTGICERFDSRRTTLELQALLVAARGAGAVITAVRVRRGQRVNAAMGAGRRGPVPAPRAASIERSGRPATPRPPLPRRAQLRAPFDALSPEALLAHFQRRGGENFFPVPDPLETRREHRRHRRGPLRVQRRVAPARCSAGPARQPSGDVEWHILLHKFYYMPRPVA